LFCEITAVKKAWHPAMIKSQHPATTPATAPAILHTATIPTMVTYCCNKNLFGAIKLNKFLLISNLTGVSLTKKTKPGAMAWAATRGF